MMVIVSDLRKGRVIVIVIVASDSAYVIHMYL